MKNSENNLYRKDCTYEEESEKKRNKTSNKCNQKFKRNEKRSY